MSDLTKRLDNLAEVLVESTEYSQYCQLTYEASAELAVQAKRITELEAALAAVTAERDALKVDAERYRFLRDAKNRRSLREFGIRRSDVYMEQFDAAIDAAIKEQQP